MEQGTKKVDTFNKGRCPNCGKEVIKTEESEICVCDCGVRFNFKIAHLLAEEAQIQGKDAALLIAVKQKEFKGKYGFGISPMDAATMIAYDNVMREHKRDHKHLEWYVAIQDPVKLKKNQEGEFVLSHINEKDHVQIPYIERIRGVLTCQPEIEIRFEKDGYNKIAYIKCSLETFVVAYIREDWPPGSMLYIFHKGYIPLE